MRLICNGRVVGQCRPKTIDTIMFNRTDSAVAENALLLSHVNPSAVEKGHAKIVKRSQKKMKTIETTHRHRDVK